MALTKKDKYWYGTDLTDLRLEMDRYSAAIGCPAEKFADSVCTCGHNVFRLESDELQGAARRTCASCGWVHLMGDSDDYAVTAEFDFHECICDAQAFLITSGVALYASSNDVRWYYIGCMCTRCNLVGVFADWKCESGDADLFLSKV